MSGQVSSFSHSLMRQAIHLAEQGIGSVAPNPSVGCVLVKEGRVIGLGRTASGGRPHAEVLALRMAGSEAQGATAYVTLEPCAHHGQTPPCAEALIQAGIREVFIAISDPDARVAGRGIAMLREAGIVVHTGLCEQEARWSHRGFFSRLQRGRPWITLKTATTANGMIADAQGQSKWITGEQARHYGHLLRSRNDAILTGIGTVIADDPLLDCRLPGLERHSPLRIVLTGSRTMPPQVRMLHDGGREVVTFSGHHLPEILKTLTTHYGINHLLIEAGHSVSSAFLQQNLVDELYWFRAPEKHFSEGLPAFSGWIAPCRPDAIRQLGKDRLEHYILETSPPDAFVIPEASFLSECSECQES